MVPLVTSIDYIQVRAVPPLVSLAKHKHTMLIVAQTVTAANRRTNTCLPTTCYTLYKNINAIFRRNRLSYLSIVGEAPWSCGRTLALDAARPRSIPVGGENY